MSLFLENLHEHNALLATLHALDSQVLQAGALATYSLQQGGKLLFCGNGGSAADSQHLAAELTGRFIKDRRPLAAMALSTDTSALTCIGNDYSFDEIFARQLVGLGRIGDVLIGISTSGNSRNVIRAVEEAQKIGMVSKGVSFMENNNEWHHNRLTKANYELALAELGVSLEGIHGVLRQLSLWNRRCSGYAIHSKHHCCIASRLCGDFQDCASRSKV